MNLRTLALALVLANILFFFWGMSTSNLQPDAKDREPQRLARQVRPEAMTLLPPDSSENFVCKRLPLDDLDEYLLWEKVLKVSSAKDQEMQMQAQTQTQMPMQIQTELHNSNVGLERWLIFFSAEKTPLNTQNFLKAAKNMGVVITEEDGALQEDDVAWIVATEPTQALANSRLKTLKDAGLPHLKVAKDVRVHELYWLDIKMPRARDEGVKSWHDWLSKMIPLIDLAVASNNPDELDMENLESRSQPISCSSFGQAERPIVGNQS